jgi:two-component system, cell cycle sensor histidine kinase and response regulator CckA
MKNTFDPAECHGPATQRLRPFILALMVFISPFILVFNAGANDGPSRIVVAGGTDYAPLGFQDAEGTPRGILVDIWRLWSRKTGVDVEYRMLPWAEALAAVDSGEADVVAGFFYSDSRAKRFDFSPPFYTISSHIFFHKSIVGIKDVADLHGFRVGVLHADYSESYLQEHVPGTEVVAFSSYQDMIHAAVGGEIRIFLCDTPVAMYYLNKLDGAGDFHHAFKPMYANQIYAGIPKGHPSINRIVAKGFTAISKKEIDRIEAQWTGSSWPGRIPWRWLAMVVGAVLMGAVLVTLGIFGLRRRVAAATADLEKKRQQLEASRQAILESERRFRALAENADDCIMRFDRKGRHLYTNPVVETLTGIAPEAFIGKTHHEIGFPPELIQRWDDAMNRVFETGEKHRLEFLLPNGVWIDWLLIPEKSPDGSTDTILTAARDITERKRFEESLLESEEKYRRLFEMESDAIFLIENESGRILEANAAAAGLYGYSLEALRRLRNTDLSAEPEATQEGIHVSQKSVPLQYHRKKDGTVFPVEIAASHFAWQGRDVHVAAIRDISVRLMAEKEKNRLEVRLHQAQKLESLGTLAGGIAHDFNNLLMGIQGRASLILLDTEPGHSAGEHARSIEKHVDSASELTRQLLGMAMTGKYEVRSLDMNALVRETAEMFGRTRKEIQVRKRCQEGLWLVEADRGQLEQVLLNLYINAWHAMPGGGSLTLSTGNVTLDEAGVHPFSVVPGNFVHVAVTDTGGGMDAETQQRIFDPFFTTKEMGRGTGLGLASVYGIIKNHHGIIRVFSEVGKGATFHIYLPQATGPLKEDSDKGEEILKGSETILLVDDEEIIIAVAEEMLQTLGYRVLVARNGRDAIDIYHRHHESIALVILDMIMPEMGGGDTFDAIRAQNPDGRVLLSSGYSVDGQATAILERGCSGFIQKPFNIKALSRKIRSVLDG